MSPLKPLSDGQRKVLEVLRAAGARGVTTSELLDSPVGSRYSARIGELRKMPGCQIRTECVRAGSYRFTLLSEPSVEVDRRIEGLIDEAERQVEGFTKPKPLPDLSKVEKVEVEAGTLFNGDENPRPLRHYEDL